ncbi:MAG: hypothetical protein H7Y88_01245 [Phycisphaerales bacterium]|nr:hypothetical protein [Phycisphaerales bacterium]
MSGMFDGALTTEGAGIATTAEFCVLASGSSGNCSVLAVTVNGVRRICLIDLGLSPRRTRRLLHERGLDFHQVDDCLITHLDHDHFHQGWVSGTPHHAAMRLHTRHEARAGRFGLFGRPPRVFEQSFQLGCGATVQAMVAAHDEAGVVAFRIDLPGSAVGGAGGTRPASLGFATDLGHVTDGLIELMRGVDVLAIESNYCPTMQAESGRPWFLRQRIMGGSGHLSNHECLEAIHRIEPREHVVLLHLSRECNCPDLVASLHEGCDYTLTITSQARPSRWVRIGRATVSNRGTVAPTPPTLPTHASPPLATMPP